MYITEIYCHRWKISSNQLLSNIFSKNVNFTKFLQKRVTVNFRNFHTVTVWSLWCAQQCGKYSNFLFRESDDFTNKYTNSLFDEKNFGREWILRFPHCDVEITEIYPRTFVTKISWKQHVYTMSSPKQEMISQNVFWWERISRFNL